MFEGELRYGLQMTTDVWRFTASSLVTYFFHAELRLGGWLVAS